MTKKVIPIFLSLIILTVSIVYITQSLFFESSEKDSEEEPDITPPLLTVPYLYEKNITSVQPYGILIKYGEDDWRPNLAIDFAGPNGTQSCEFAPAENKVNDHLRLLETEKQKI